MFGGSLGVILGVIGLPWVAKVVLWVPWLALAWTVAVVQWTASLPFASLTIAGYGTPALVLTYALIFGLRWRRTLQRAGGKLFGWLRRDWVARLATPGAASVLTVTAALLWAGALTQPDGRLHVWFLDIGQGDGILHPDALGPPGAHRRRRQPPGALCGAGRGDALLGPEPGSGRC